MLMLRKSSMFAGVFAALVAAWATAPGQGYAQDDGAAPMSDLPPEDMVTTDGFSVRGGRLLGAGQMALAAGAGWPGIFAELVIGASAGFNLGPRVDFLYATPLLGGRVGVGTEISLPMRIHVYEVAEHNIDVAIVARPFFLLGRGGLVGGRGTFNDDLGLGFGAVVGARVSGGSSRPS